jgi:hypothetical protein
MNIAVLPGVIQYSKRTMWPTAFLLHASPGWRSTAWMAFETVVSKGANSLVTRPGAGRFHAHEMKPEQSDR